MGYTSELQIAVAVIATLSVMTLLLEEAISGLYLM
jgi:hypothetical protein